jgi:hypothetical protein
VIVFAIDPGPVRSAWCLYGGPALVFGIDENDDLLARLGPAPRVVIEKVESFGMPVGAEVFETVYWSGRFAQKAIASLATVDRIGRKAIKVHLCGTTKAKDPNIRQALLDRFGPQGTKAHPGFLYGVSKDVWSALAVAVTWSDQHGGTDASSTR